MISFWDVVIAALPDFAARAFVQFLLLWLVFMMFYVPIVMWVFATKREDA